jgi:hypothetical protein
MDKNTSFIFIKPREKLSSLWNIFCKTPSRYVEKTENFAEQEFNYFIKNSNIELLSDSSAFGFVYKCTFRKNPEKSPYFYLNAKGETLDVTIIVIKCLLLNDRVINDTDEFHKWEYNKLDGKVSIRHFDMKNRFINEVQKQTDISKLGIVSLNRNAPVVLFSKILGKKSYYSFASMIQKQIINNPKNNPFNQLIDTLKMKQKQPNSGLEYFFGIVAMEYIETQYTMFYNIVKPIIVDDILKRENCYHIHKYDSLSLSPHSDRLRWAYNTGRYEILRMALDTGYTEGDYHTDNLLIDEHCRKVILVDYGRSEKLVNLDKLKKLWDNKNIKEMLKFVFYSTFIDDEKGDEFKWLHCIDDEDAIIIEYIHKHRETLIENLTPELITEGMQNYHTFDGFCSYSY